MENTYEFKSKVRVAISEVCNLRCKYCDNSYIRSNKRTIAMEDFRTKSLREGCIEANTYIKILESFYKNGFKRVNFTGGEPMLNNRWDFIAIETKSIGFDSVEMTTNGTLISDYLDTHDKFPESLDRLIISLDTHDKNKYCQIVGREVDLFSVANSVKRLKQCNPNLKLTANRVLTKSDANDLEDYIEFVKEIGFDSITFLDLVIRNKRDKKEINFFLREFFSGQEIKNFLERIYGNLTVYEDRHDYNVILPNKLQVSVVDTKGLTKRDKICLECDTFCQEGFYTARVATDGTISDCLGSQGILIDGVAALLNGTIDCEIKRIFDRLAEGKRGRYFNVFYDSIKDVN